MDEIKEQTDSVNLVEALDKENEASEEKLRLVAEELENLKVIVREAEISTTSAEKEIVLEMEVFGVEPENEQFDDDAEDSEKENDGYVEIELNVGESGPNGGPLVTRYPSNLTGLTADIVNRVLNNDEGMQGQIWDAAVAYVGHRRTSALLEHFRDAGLLALFEDLYDLHHIRAASLIE